MWEFVKKHKIAVFGSFGILLLLYVYYEYEQAQSANAASSGANANDLASALTAASLPSLYGGSGGTIGPISSGSGQVPLANYLTPTGTSAANIPSSTVAATAIPSLSTSSGSPSVVPNPSSGGGSAALSGDALTQAVMQATAPCQYQLPGVSINPGIPICGPGGQQTAPEVAGLYPGQAGYTQDLQAELSSAQNAAANGSGSAATVTDLQNLLDQYGGLDAAAEGSVTPAGSTQTTPAPTVAPGNIATSTPATPAAGRGTGLVRLAGAASLAAAASAAGSIINSSTILPGPTKPMPTPANPAQPVAVTPVSVRRPITTVGTPTATGRF